MTKDLQQNCTVICLFRSHDCKLCKRHQQAWRDAQVQSLLKPVGPQQLAKVTFCPCLLADQFHTLLSEANLPFGSSSCAASVCVSRTKSEYCTAYQPHGTHTYKNSHTCRMTIPAQHDLLPLCTTAYTCPVSSNMMSNSSC